MVTVANHFYRFVSWSTVLNENCNVNFLKVAKALFVMLSWFPPKLLAKQQASSLAMPFNALIYIMGYYNLSIGITT